MVIGAKHAGLDIPDTADLLGFSTQSSLGFTGNGPEKRKYAGSVSALSKNALLVSEVKGEWPRSVELIGRTQ